MPYDDPDATDPMTLHGVAVETDDPDAARNMADCFIEELVRLGFDAPRIREVFVDQRFAGPAMATRQLGMSAIEKLIDFHLRIRGPRAARSCVDRRADGAIELPIL